MNNKITISLVSYLNTKPFLYGLEHSPIKSKLNLQLDIPSIGGNKLLNNLVDIGLVPVAVLAKLNDAEIITDYCIGADGPVKSVSVFSEVPIERIENIYLDHHSLTSVQLLKLLLKEYWKINPIQIDATEGYIEKIKGTTAGLVIGDRALWLYNKYAHVYDLSEAWKQLTGLPFVFAAWVTRKKQFSDIIFELNEALKYGVHNIDAVAEAYQTDLFSTNELRDYLKNNIDFHLDDIKRRALDLFLSKIKS